MTPADPALDAIDAITASLAPLPAPVAARLAAAVAQARAAQAIGELAHELDPAGTRSRWSLARELEQRLLRFETRGGWRAIRTGTRPPRDRLEQMLATALDGDPPRTQRRIHDWLV